MSGGGMDLTEWENRRGRPTSSPSSPILAHLKDSNKFQFLAPQPVLCLHVLHWWQFAQNRVCHHATSQGSSVASHTILDESDNWYMGLPIKFGGHYVDLRLDESANELPDSSCLYTMLWHCTLGLTEMDRRVMISQQNDLDKWMFLERPCHCEEWLCLKLCTVLDVRLDCLEAVFFAGQNISTSDHHCRPIQLTQNMSNMQALEV